MFNRIIIENKQNNRVFMLFPSLNDVENDKVIKKICEILHIFSDSFYVRLTYKNGVSVLSGINGIELNKCITESINKNITATVFKADVPLFYEVAKQIDFDKVCLELIADNGKLLLKQAICTQEENVDFIFVCADNDGPYLVFNAFEYDRHLIIERIKKIIKNNKKQV